MSISKEADILHISGTTADDNHRAHTWVFSILYKTGHCLQSNLWTNAALLYQTTISLIMYTAWQPKHNLSAWKQCSLAH